MQFYVFWTNFVIFWDNFDLKIQFRATIWMDFECTYSCQQQGHNIHNYKRHKKSLFKAPVRSLYKPLCICIGWSVGLPKKFPQHVFRTKANLNL